MSELDIIKDISNILAYFIKFIGVFLSKCEKLLTSELDDTNWDINNNNDYSNNSNQIDSLNKLSKKEEELNNKEKELSKREEELKVLEKQFIEKDQKILKLNETINMQKCNLENFKIKITSLSQQIEDKESENEKMKKLMFAIRNSQKNNST